MLLALATAQAVAVSGSSIVIESFDQPKHHWESHNDPGLEPGHLHFKLSTYRCIPYTLHKNTRQNVALNDPKYQQQIPHSDGREIDIDDKDC